MEQYSDPIIQSQPPPAAVYTSGAVVGGWGMDGGMMNVRQMTEQDAAFVARLQMEAFREKFEWAVGKSNVDDVARRIGDALRKSPQWWPRNFIVEYNNQAAGSMVLSFYADKSLAQPNMDTSGMSCSALCGLICMEVCLNEEVNNPSRCYLEVICVDSNFRGKGIGKILLDKAEDEARAMGCRMIYLNVKKTNRAKHLYERQGYRVTESNDGCCCTYCAVGERYFDLMEKQLY